MKRLCLFLTAVVLASSPADANGPRGGGASFQLNVNRGFNVGVNRGFAFRQRAFAPSYGYAVQQQVFAAPVYQQQVVQQVVQVPVYQLQTFQVQQQQFAPSYAPAFAPSCGGAAFGLGSGCGAGSVQRSFSFGAGYGR